MMIFFYKWLPIIFGCHCRPDRSFFYKGKQFPICARCTGELIGIIIAILVYFFYQTPLFTCILLMIPMICDGFIQLLTSYESHNITRCITGFLFGFALTTLFIISTLVIFQAGIELGQTLKNK
jgi:uncharacterized membrane protein